MGITNFVLINHNIKIPILKTLKQEISKDRENETIHKDLPWFTLSWFQPNHDKATSNKTHTPFFTISHKNQGIKCYHLQPKGLNWNLVQTITNLPSPGRFKPSSTLDEWKNIQKLPQCDESRCVCFCLVKLRTLFSQNINFGSQRKNEWKLWKTTSKRLI